MRWLRSALARRIATRVSRSGGWISAIRPHSKRERHREGGGVWGWVAGPEGEGGQRVARVELRRRSRERVRVAGIAAVVAPAPARDGAGISGLLIGRAPRRPLLTARAAPDAAWI